MNKILYNLAFKELQQYVRLQIACRWSCTSLHYWKLVGLCRFWILFFFWTKSRFCILVEYNTLLLPLLSFWRLEYLGIGLFLSLSSFWRATNLVASIRNWSIVAKNVRLLDLLWTSFCTSCHYLIFITSLEPHNLKIKIYILLKSKAFNVATFTLSYISSHVIIFCFQFFLYIFF